MYTRTRAPITIIQHVQQYTTDKARGTESDFSLRADGIQTISLHFASDPRPARTTPLADLTGENVETEKFLILWRRVSPCSKHILRCAVHIRKRFLFPRDKSFPLSPPPHAHIGARATPSIEIS